MKRTIISGEFYNALYEDGKLKYQAKDDYLNTETLHTIFPDAEYYGIPWQMIDDIVSDGYPELLSDLPLDQCVKYWPRDD